MAFKSFNESDDWIPLLGDKKGTALLDNAPITGHNGITSSPSQNYLSALHTWDLKLFFNTEHCNLLSSFMNLALKLFEPAIQYFKTITEYVI